MTKAWEDEKMRGEKVFLVEGELVLKGRRQSFSKEVKAKSSAYAAEKAMALFGSKNKLKRNKILLREVKEVEEDGKKESD